MDVYFTFEELGFMMSHLLNITPVNDYDNIMLLNCIEKMKIAYESNVTKPQI